MTPARRELALVRRCLLALVACGASVAAPSALAVPPAVSITPLSTSGTAPFTATLAATGDPATYHWRLGDGSTADGPLIRHTWGRPGHFVVRVVATAPTGESTAARATVTAYRLTLKAATAARYGAAVALKGRLLPPQAGRAAVLLGRRLVAEPRLRAGGRFRVVTRLVQPGPWSARVGALRSAPLEILVRPQLEASLVGVPVVGAPLAVRASVRPARAGPVTLTVSRGGRARRRTFAGATRVGLASGRPQTIRVTLSTHAVPGYAAASKTVSFAVRPAALAAGARGAAVVYLQQRLLALRYALRGVSGTFGDDTYEAVIAFQKTVGLPRTGRVDEPFWRALASAHVPVPRILSGSHIEVDKGRQLLFQVAHGRVTRIIGVSTGATGNTPVGLWHVYRKVPGYDWVLWYPLYFLRGFAVHGYPDVPPFPASHGCVRVPMWLAPSLYAAYGYGTLVAIY